MAWPWRLGKRFHEMMFPVRRHADTYLHSEGHGRFGLPKICVEYDKSFCAWYNYSLPRQFA